MRILHVIHGFHPGGGFRALVTLAAQCLEIDPGATHRLAGLASDDTPEGAAMARRAGLEVLGRRGPEALAEAVADSDIVHLHFWNTPEIYEFLRADLPPLRLLVTMHVGGAHAPQVITRDLVDVADRIQNTGPFTHARPVYDELGPAQRAQKVRLTYCPADLRRLGDVRPRPHDGLTVLFLGALDFVKMHPDFVALCASVRTPGVRFVVCGEGAALPVLERQAREAGMADRMEFLGRREDIAPVLASADVFGYPLCADNYSSGELVLQEAAHAGLPAVVFAGGGAGSMVEDGVTGRVVESAARYRDAVEALLESPEERRRLGDNARRTAERLYRWGRAGQETLALYAEMLALPRRARRLPAPDLPGAEAGGSRLGACRFVQSLGSEGDDFRASLAASGLAEAREADGRIAAAGPGLARGSGGVACYRDRHPDDPLLQYWAGLTDLARGRADLALVAFHRAGRLGLDPERAAWGFARAADLLGEPDLAREAMQRLPHADAAWREAAAGADAGRGVARSEKFEALCAVGALARAADLAFGPLLREPTREARERLYRFGLACHGAGLGDLAERAYRRTAQLTGEDADLAAWAHCKLGELFLDRGEERAARELFAAALARKPDLGKARVLAAPADAPLRVSLGESEPPAGFIALAMDPCDASLWPYYFGRRRPDALRLALDRNPDPGRADQVAGLAAHWLAPGGELVLLVPEPDGLDPACRDAFARRLPGTRLALERFRPGPA